MFHNDEHGHRSMSFEPSIRASGASSLPPTRYPHEIISYSRFDGASDTSIEQHQPKSVPAKLGKEHATNREQSSYASQLGREYFSQDSSLPVSESAAAEPHGVGLSNETSSTPEPSPPPSTEYLPIAVGQKPQRSCTPSYTMSEKSHVSSFQTTFKLDQPRFTDIPAALLFIATLIAFIVISVLQVVKFMGWMKAEKQYEEIKIIWLA